MTTIKCKKNLYNGGLCFTKGKKYEASGNASTRASLMDMRTVNDQGQTHIIGSWWRNFDIVAY